MEVAQEAAEAPPGEEMQAQELYEGIPESDEELDKYVTKLLSPLSALAKIVPPTPDSVQDERTLLESLWRMFERNNNICEPYRPDARYTGALLRNPDSIPTLVACLRDASYSDFIPDGPVRVRLHKHVFAILVLSELYYGLDYPPAAEPRPQPTEATDYLFRHLQAVTAAACTCLRACLSVSEPRPPPPGAPLGSLAALSAAQTDPSLLLWQQYRDGAAAYLVHLARCCVRLLRHVSSAGSVADPRAFVEAAVAALHALDSCTVQMARAALLRSQHSPLASSYLLCRFHPLRSARAVQTLSMLWAWLDCNPDNADALTAHPDALPRLAALLSPSTLPPFREEDPEDSRDGRDTRQEIVQCAVGMWWGCSSRVSALAVRRALAAGVGDAVLALLSSGDAEGAAKAHFCASGTLAAWFVVAPAEMAGLWARAKGEAVGFVKHAVGCLLQGAGREDYAGLRLRRQSAAAAASSPLALAAGDGAGSASAAAAEGSDPARAAAEDTAAAAAADAGAAADSHADGVGAGGAPGDASAADAARRRAVEDRRGSNGAAGPRSRSRGYFVFSNLLTNFDWKERDLIEAISLLCRALAPGPRRDADAAYVSALTLYLLTSPAGPRSVLSDKQRAWLAQDPRLAAALHQMATSSHVPSVDLAVEALAHIAAAPQAAEAVLGIVMRPLRDLGQLRPDARLLLRREARGCAVPANRSALASASPFFEALFRTPMHRAAAPEHAHADLAAGADADADASALSSRQQSVVLQDALSADISVVSAYAATGGFAFRSLREALEAVEAFDRALMREAAAAAAEAAKAFVRGENAVELVLFAHGKAGREALLRFGVDHILHEGSLESLVLSGGVNALPREIRTLVLREAARNSDAMAARGAAAALPRAACAAALSAPAGAAQRHVAQAAGAGGAPASSRGGGAGGAEAGVAPDPGVVVSAPDARAAAVGGFEVNAGADPGGGALPAGRQHSGGAAAAAGGGAAEGGVEATDGGGAAAGTGVISDEQHRSSKRQRAM